MDLKNLPKGWNVRSKKRKPKTLTAGQRLENSIVDAHLRKPLVNRSDAGIFILPHAPGLNGSGGLARMHWSKKKRLLGNLTRFVELQLRYQQPQGFEHVYYQRIYPANTFMDQDNLLSSFKLIGDALEAAGVIEDDKLFKIKAECVKLKGLRCSLVVLLPQADDELAMEIFDDIYTALFHCVGLNSV